MSLGPALRRKLTYALIYFIAAWHAYAILTRPLLTLGFALPLQQSVIHYSDDLHLMPSWAFFYRQSPVNLNLSYSVNSEENTHVFYGDLSDYSHRIRNFRCLACSDAVNQFFYKETPAGGKWQIGSYLCALEPQGSVITLELKSSPYDSLNFQTVKKTEITCNDFR